MNADWLQGYKSTNVELFNGDKFLNATRMKCLNFGKLLYHVYVVWKFEIWILGKKIERTLSVLFSWRTTWLGVFWLGLSNRKMAKIWNYTTVISQND